MANPKTPITELDFDGAKAQLKQYLRTQTQFKDYDFEGSNMSVLLDVLAYNTFQNNFYTNMAINEMFLDSAVLKNSIVSHAKELNYLPRSRKSAKAVVNVTIIDPVETSQTIEIPRFTDFSSNYLGENYNFVTDQTYVARRVSVDPAAGIGEGTFVVEGVEIFEGQTLTSFQREGFIIDADGKLRVQLTNDNTDIDSLVVFVDAEETEDKNIFIRANSIFGVRPDDKVFYVEAYFDNSYAIYFGGNNYGIQPEPFEDVRVQYRITSGDEGNGAFSFSTGFRDGEINVETVSPAQGGLERESIDSIRYFAPKSLQIQDRAVTTKDYEILLQQRFPEITAVSAYGGEDLDPPQFGRVAISVFLQDDAQLISTTLANTFIEYLKERSPLSIEPVFVQTQFLYADIHAKISYTGKLSEKTPQEFEVMVRNAIQTYSDSSLEQFNATLRSSKLASNIDALDTAIESCQLDIRPIIQYSPVLNVASNPRFRFETKLTKPYPFRLTNGFNDYKPAIKSSVFDTTGGVCVFIQDDGEGKLQLVTDNLTNPQIVNPSAGTIDYETGDVRLSKLLVEGFPGQAIKIMAKTDTDDIKSPTGRVFIIRDSDVRFSATREDNDAYGSLDGNISRTSTTTY